MKIARNTNIELLRFVLMLFIFCWHIIMHGFGFKDISNVKFVLDGSFGITAALCALTAPATYCFIFISGYFGIKYNARKVLAMWIWLFVVAIVCSILSYTIMGGASNSRVYCFIGSC